MSTNYYTDCHSGHYTLINPGKYLPDLPPPVFKSSWEEKICIACDVNDFITRWGYEPFEISYYSPLYMKQSIYIPDVYVECRYANGVEQRYLLEIKPVAYSVLPKEPKAPGPNVKDTRRWDNYRKKKAAFDRKTMDVMVNYAKWEAAEQWCKAHNINWLILNEKNMHGLFDSKTVI